MAPVTAPFLIFPVITEFALSCLLPTEFLGNPAATARPPRATNRARQDITLANVSRVRRVFIGFRFGGRDRTRPRIDYLRWEAGGGQRFEDGAPSARKFGRGFFLPTDRERGFGLGGGFGFGGCLKGGTELALVDLAAFENQFGGILARVQILSGCPGQSRRRSGAVLSECVQRLISRIGLRRAGLRGGGRRGRSCRPPSRPLPQPAATNVTTASDGRSNLKEQEPTPEKADAPMSEEVRL